MITALTDPTQMPTQLDDQETFDTKWANVLDNLAERARQENELAANMGMFAAGGTYAFPYVFDSSTVDADPGVGKLRLSNTTQTGSASLRMDVQIVGGVDISNVFADLRASTSAVKGSIRLVKMTDPSNWVIFDVSAVALPTGYRNLSVVSRASSSTNPFTHGDPLLVYIDRNGDKGDLPLGGALTCLVAENISSPVLAINYPNVFTADYDHYLIVLSEFQVSTNAVLSLRLAANGAFVTTGVYSSMISPVFSTGTSASNTSCTISAGSISSSLVSSGITLELVNPRSISADKFITMEGGVRLGGNANPVTMAGQAVATIAEQVTGFQLLLNNGASFTRAKLRVFGYRNQTGPGVF